MDLNENADLDTSQVEDVRGGGGGGGGGFNLPIGGRGLAGTLVGLIVVVLLGVLGVNQFTGDSSGGGGGTADNSDLNAKCAKSNPNRFNETDCVNLLYVNSIQDHWRRTLPATFGVQYQLATTRYFSGAVSTACGDADSGVGPFYCPADHHVYIDLTFYDELARRFGAPGRFAQAYVLAHEYGHHVQSLLGTEAQMRRAQQRDPGNANRYSIALELQADCYAGVWAKSATQTTDANGNALFKSVTDQDIAQALQAAAAVGDDAIQKKSTGRVNQDTWTHGSSEDRQRWFSQGNTTGDPKRCDTFGGSL